MTPAPVRTLILGHPTDLLNPHCTTLHDSPLHAAVSRLSYVLFEQGASFTPEQLASIGIDPDWMTLLAVRLEMLAEGME